MHRHSCDANAQTVVSSSKHMARSGTELGTKTHFQLICFFQESQITQLQLLCPALKQQLASQSLCNIYYTRIFPPSALRELQNKNQFVP